MHPRDGNEHTPFIEFVTLAVFQLATLALNAVVPLNTLFMFVAHATFHVPMGWLNADAYWNICEQHRGMAPKRAGQPHDAAT